MAGILLCPAKVCATVSYVDIQVQLLHHLISVSEKDLNERAIFKKSCFLFLDK